MPPSQMTPRLFFIDALAKDHPSAVAWVTDNPENPHVSGLIKFYQPSNGGVLVEAEVFGLPDSPDVPSHFFAMHIHDAPACRRSHSFRDPAYNSMHQQPAQDSMKHTYAPAGSHWNPQNTAHPFHAGDMPPLLSSQGYAWTAFFDRRFTVDDIIGKTVVIHAGVDDFTTQPSGNAGNQLACGEIRKSW